MKKYVNTSGDWGEQTEVTIDDYKKQEEVDRRAMPDDFQGVPFHAWTQNDEGIYCDGRPVAKAQLRKVGAFLEMALYPLRHGI